MCCRELMIVAHMSREVAGRGGAYLVGNGNVKFLGKEKGALTEARAHAQY